MNDADLNNLSADSSELEREKRELLAVLLSEQGESEAEDHGIPKLRASAGFPLSYAQERMWFLEQLEPGRAIYNISGLLRLRGRLNVAALEASVRELIERHEVLRTTVVTREGAPVAVLRDASAMSVALLDLSAVSAVEREATARRTAFEASRRPFDIASDYLLRPILMKLGEQEHWLLLTVHHIAFDAWSGGILCGELAQLYAAACEGRASPLAPLPIQCADFAAWQRERVGGHRLDASLDYWRAKLRGPLPILQLPLDRRRPAVQSFDGATVTFALSAELTAGLYRLARELGATVFVVLLAAFRTLLHRYTGQSDILIGSPFADRPRVETEGLIGPFINNVVMRTALSGALAFRDLVMRERETFLQASEHRDVAFERVVEELNPERDRSRSPIFQVMFAFFNAPAPALHLEGLTLEPIDEHSGTSEFDLSLYVHAPEAKAGAISGHFEYANALFDAATIEALGAHLRRLLEAVVAAPESALGELPLLSAAEMHRVLVEWNATARALPVETSIHALFEAQVRRTPQATALVCEDCTLGYAELNARANRLAQGLIAVGVGAEVLVGVMTDRRSDMVVALLAVLKAGGAYLPIDPAFPPSRIAHMIEDSGTPLILTQSALAQALPPTSARVIELDRERAWLEPFDSTDPQAQTLSHHLAYTIYTSGSTGKPKGVQIEHRAVVNLLTSIHSRPGIGPTDTLLALTTVSFDIHVLEIFGPLTAGGCVIVGSRGTAADGQRLYDAMVEHRVTMIQATPATWRLLLAAWPKENAYRLKKILCGGEALPRALADALRGHAEQLWNLYGPTETTVWSAAGEVAHGQSAPSVGRPLANTEMYILDERLRPVPVGVLGELYIGGVGVARGYLGRPDLTSARFIAHPFHRKASPLYRTGDLARYRRDGTLEIGARTDTQVKIRGYRVELGEIESALLQHPAVAEAVAVVREIDADDQRLLAYVVSSGPDRPEAGVLRAHVQVHLPEYMVPSAYILLDRLPLTPNGKVDRLALPPPVVNITPADAGFTAPQTETEVLLAGIFTDVLQIERVGRYDNFFDLGGHSLLAMKVVDRFQKATGIRMEPGELFQQTVGQIVASHEARSAAASTIPARSPKGRLRSALAGLFLPSARS